MKVWVVESGVYYDTPEYVALFFFHRSAVLTVLRLMEDHPDWIVEGNDNDMTYSRDYDYIRIFRAPVNFLAGREIRSLQTPFTLHVGQKNIPYVENLGNYQEVNTLRMLPNKHVYRLGESHYCQEPDCPARKD